MKTKELRLKTKDELEKMLGENRVKLRDLRFKLAGTKLKDFSEIGKLRRNIARLLTVLKANK